MMPRIRYSRHQFFNELVKQKYIKKRQENNMSEEKDYLKDFIKNNEQNNTEIENIDTSNIQVYGNNVKQKVEYIETTLEQQWHNIDITILPFSKFYPIGTRLFIRAAKTKEIEAFSVINEHNHYDVHLKIIQMLQACTQLKYIDGTTGSYKDIMYGDRDVLLMLIAKLTSKSGRKIYKKIKCSCGHETDVDYIPANYIYENENEKIKKYFNATTRNYHFKLKNGSEVFLKPPTLGIVESLNNYIFYNTMKSQQESADNSISYTPNISFMENITYLKSGLNIKELEIKEWEQEEYEYERMNDQYFMFIDEAIKMMTHGIKKIETQCTSETCNNNVSIPFHFPDGIRALFIIPNAFDEFIL